MFLYTDFLSLSEQLSCFCVCLLIGMFAVLANWWISGLRSRTERGKAKEGREGKWQTEPWWDSSQLPSRYLPSQCDISATSNWVHTGAASYHHSCSFSLTHTPTKTGELFSPPLWFEISCSNAKLCWKERTQKKKKEMLSLLCGHYCGRSDSMPSQETPWLCYCHHCGHSKSLQPSEINTSWPAACSLRLDGDTRLIQGDRTCDLSQLKPGCPDWAWTLTNATQH